MNKKYKICIGQILHPEFAYFKRKSSRSHRYDIIITLSTKSIFHSLMPKFFRFFIAFQYHKPWNDLFCQKSVKYRRDGVEIDERNIWCNELMQRNIYEDLQVIPGDLCRKFMNPGDLCRSKKSFSYQKSSKFRRNCAKVDEDLLVNPGDLCRRFMNPGYLCRSKKSFREIRKYSN